MLESKSKCQTKNLRRGDSDCRTKSTSRHSSSTNKLDTARLITQLLESNTLGLGANSLGLYQGTWTTNYQTWPVTVSGAYTVDDM